MRTRSYCVLLPSRFLVFLTGAVLAVAAEADEKPGYTDTPMLPDSEWRVHDRERPQPPSVTPGATAADPPSDAIVLFDGTNLDAWEGGTAEAIEDGAFNIVKTSGLTTKQKFGDCQLHIEWATPAEADGNAMNWGNSGVFFQGLYELQVIESRACHIYADGIAGSIYGQVPPLVNPCREPGQWQSFDAVFLAPKFEGDQLVEPARMTVFYNGVLVLYHAKVLGATRHKTLPSYSVPAETGPLVLQQHHSAVRFRNIWVRPLTLDQ